MPAVEVGKSQWAEFLTGFARKHQNWLASVETVDKSTGQVRESHLVRLNAVSVEGQEEPFQIVIVGETEQSKISQLVRHPEKIVVTRDQMGADQELVIESPSGIVVVRLKTAILPELVDGVA